MRVKICGITRPGDAVVADEAGADAIGVVMYSQSPRSVDIETAEEIFGAAGPYLARVCVSHTGSLWDIEAMLDLNPDVLQISSPLALPHPFPVRLIRVVGSGQALPGDADAILIDGSSGKGVLYDEEFASRVVTESRVPVILAGGLNPGNVERAIRRVRPYGVDVATGVEDSPGVKNEQKVREFVRNAKGVNCD